MEKFIYLRITAVKWVESVIVRIFRDYVCKYIVLFWSGKANAQSQGQVGEFCYFFDYAGTL